MPGPLLLTILLALLLSPSVAAAQGGATLTVEPPSGPPGTTFQPLATGLPPGRAVIAIVRLPTGEQAVTAVPELVSPAGAWPAPPWQTRQSDPVGQYTVLVATPDRATVLASGTFTVTGPAPTRPPPGRPPVQLPGTR